MRLTLYTDYALRILMYLAAYNEGLVTAQEIAKAYKISKNHLLKVINTLVKAGFIEAIRGKNGGLRLLANLKEKKLGEIIRMTEPDLALVECFLPTNSCVITPICQLKHILNQATNKLLTELDNYNIDELIPDKEGMRSFFNQIK